MDASPISRFDVVYMRLAADMASLATCTSRRIVGAVIIDSRRYLISSGYNGAPHGVTHCDEVGCVLDSTGSCIRAVHAEMNAILQCARRGVSCEGGTIYSTCFPCPSCALHIAQAGISKLVWAYDYRDTVKFNNALSILVDSKVQILRFTQQLSFQVFDTEVYETP